MIHFYLFNQFHPTFFCTLFEKEEKKQLPLKHYVKNMIATNLSSVLLNMKTCIYQPLHVGYHEKFHANYSLDVIVSTKKSLLLKHTLELLCTYLKESSHLKCSFNMIIHQVFWINFVNLFHFQVLLQCLMLIDKF